MEFTKRTGLSIFEASAKTGSGVEQSFVALTDALIDLSSKSDGRTSVSSNTANSTTSAVENPYANPPFDDGRIKMKRIEGRGLSGTDKAALYCC
mmetsp:Transcript_11539/g.17400  ORF Transcript_11539/g.17400 Transcript_11539/m.17400 type:complete len:94 (+) Transcript_11539:598-879(+)|eukprot:CAMPEP_0170491804 /NCGR_PEP_ID=MMETSP0208-20121228/11264_1 /TAXON_ID=197538 /ORGANISM="Strombidium inclinatum, Strain S3" /LENGTH=93 /DNA_ID=CAMNT_0010767439 /DNA_START=597 /DNA_END=881 /DNA_ORIENTATION=-